MEILAAGLGLLGTIIKMIEEGQHASAEKSAEILARFTAAESTLKGAYDEAHALLDVIRAQP